MSDQQQVKIHINKEKYVSPNPTTGAALYALGSVPPELDLYRDEGGNGDGELLENGPEAVHLKNSDHFHSGPRKALTIYVNGQPKQVTEKKLTFEQVVALAFPTPSTGQNILFTVSYEDGPNANPAGSLMPGGTVKLKNGMIFNVTATDKS
jgi:hypothetical protein